MCSLSSVSSPASCGGRRLLRHEGAVSMRHGTAQDRVRSCSRGTGAPAAGTFPERFPEGSPRRGPGSSLPPGGPPSPRSPERSAWASSPGSGFPEAGPIPLTASGPFRLMALTGLPPAAALALCLCRGAGLARGPSGRLWRGRLSPGPRGSSTLRCRVPTRVSRRREFRAAPRRGGHSQVAVLPGRLQHVLSPQLAVQPAVKLSQTESKRFTGTASTASAS